MKLPTPARVRSLSIRATWSLFARQNIAYATPASLAPKLRKGYDYEAQAQAAVILVRESTQLSYERLVTLYGQVAYAEGCGLAGALVECGVWRGGASALMALASLNHSAKRRDIHMFDSFQGMPEPRAGLDGQDALQLAGSLGNGELRTTGFNVASAEQVRGLVIDRVGYPPDHVHVHEGWFQDTLPVTAPIIGDIAVLRLDGDWYESTMVCLQHLYDLVVTGGVIIIDDYGHFEGCRRATDDFLARRGLCVYLSHIDYSGRYFIKS
jgi:hypothetical protein